MKGVSGIVSTAILLALTIAGGVLIYTYVTRYLNTIAENGKLVIENAYYLSSTKNLAIEVRNVGTREVSVNRVNVITESGKSYSYNISNTQPLITIFPGDLRSIEITLDTTELPRYVIVIYNNISTEPATVRVIG
jgi:archaeal flagellin N-terminal-like domain